MQTLLFQRKNNFAESHERSLTTVILKTFRVSDSTLHTASPCKRTDQSYASSHYKHQTGRRQTHFTIRQRPARVHKNNSKHSLSTEEDRDELRREGGRGLEKSNVRLKQCTAGIDDYIGL